MPISQIVYPPAGSTPCREPGAPEGEAGKPGESGRRDSAAERAPMAAPARPVVLPSNEDPLAIRGW
jgi:hypothetical protein